MKTREEAYKLLLEAGITNDLADIDMVNRIADVLEKVIQDRNGLTEYKDTTIKYISTINELKKNIRRLLDGEEVARWESDDEY
jgi:hypothetical protein